MVARIRTNRREFLEQVAAWSAGVAAVPVFRVAYAQDAVPLPIVPKPVLAVGTGKDYVKLVGAVLKPLGGIEAFVKKDHRVVVKPNMAWDRKPEQAANTHPDVVKAIVKLCLDAGAKQVNVFDRTCNDKRLAYKNSGIRDAVEAIGDKRAKCPYFDDRKVMPVKIDKGQATKEWELYKEAIDADCYINVPIAKNHGISKLTLGLKNVMGVMGGRRGKIHRTLAQSLADLNSVVAPELTVIDATRILLRHGPQGGNLDDVETRDTIIASSDIVAADAYATTLFGMKPEDLSSTVAAHKMGLGEMDLEKIKVVKV